MDKLKIEDKKCVYKGGIGDAMKWRITMSEEGRGEERNREKKKR